MKTKISKFIAWKLPPRVLLWAVIRGFTDATTGENSSVEGMSVTYDDVYKAIVKKYKIKCECGKIH